MKYFFLIISSLVFFQNSSAQDTISTIQVIPKEEIKFRKNEIGISINPILMVALGAYDWPTRWAVTYRRHLNEKFSLRLIVGFQFNTGDGSEIYGNVIDINDSSGYRISTKTNLLEGYTTQIGLQHNWGQKKLKWFTGVDMIYKNLQNTQITDSTYGLTNSQYPNFLRPISYTEIQKTIHTENHIGIFPFIGIRAQFSKHWGFSTHFGWSFTLARESDFFYRYNVPEPGHVFFTRNFDVEAFFQDVSLIFRF